MMHMIWLLTFMIKFDLVVSDVLRSRVRTDVDINRNIEVYLLPVESTLLSAIRSQHTTHF